MRSGTNYTGVCSLCSMRYRGETGFNAHYGPAPVTETSESKEECGSVQLWSGDDRREASYQTAQRGPEDSQWHGQWPAHQWPQWAHCSGLPATGPGGHLEQRQRQRDWTIVRSTEIFFQTFTFIKHLTLVQCWHHIWLWILTPLPSSWQGTELMSEKLPTHFFPFIKQ